MTQRSPRVTVVIAVHNDAGRLPRSVQAVRSQTVTDWELIIADDGSTDATLEVARRLAEEDARIQVLELVHAGAARARNLAAQHGSGEWLAIHDADDMAAPDRLGRQLAFLEVHPTVGAVGSYGHRVSSDGRSLGLIESGPTSIEAFRAQRLERPTYVMNGSVTMRRSTFLEVGGYPEDYRVAEDLALYTLRMARRCDIVTLPEPLMTVEVHGDSLSRRYAEQIIEADDIVRFNLARVNSGLPELPYRQALLELQQASGLQRLARRRRELRHAWFARGAAAVAAHDLSGVPLLLMSFLIAPGWTAKRLGPRLADFRAR